MEPATADRKDGDQDQQQQHQQQQRERARQGQRRARAPPLWLLVLVTTCVTVFAPVLVGLLLIARNSNARLGATQLRSVTANASGLAQLVVERLVAAESAAHYISSFIRFSGGPLVYDSPHFYHTLAQALVSFDASTTTCFTNARNYLYGLTWDAAAPAGFAFFVSNESTGAMCRVHCDRDFEHCDYTAADPAHVDFCETRYNESAMPWADGVDRRVPQDARWSRLYTWGRVVYLSFAVAVHRDGAYAGIASVDWALEEIRQLIHFSIDTSSNVLNSTRSQAAAEAATTASSSSASSTTSSSTPSTIAVSSSEPSSSSSSSSSSTASSTTKEEDPPKVDPPRTVGGQAADNSVARLIALIERDTLNVLATTSARMQMGGYDNATGTYNVHTITEFETRSGLWPVSCYVNATLGGWGAVNATTAFRTEGFVAALVPVTRAGLSLLLVFVARESAVQLPATSVVVPVLVTVALVLPMLVVTLGIVESVARTSRAMKALSELDFARAALRDGTRFAEVRAIRAAFAKLRSATLALTKYVSPLVVRQVLRRRDAEGAHVEMDLAHLSIVFADMGGLKEGTTTTTTTLGSTGSGTGIGSNSGSTRADATDLLSRWFSTAGAVIDANHGMIDKFVEDCVMALFGAPEPLPANELCACRCALALARRFAAFKARAGLAHVAALQFRAGVHCGDVLVGNVGTADHLNYTVCGMCANTASRVTELCTRYALAPLVTGDVHARVKDVYLCALVDVVLLRGHRHVHTRVYHLIADHAHATPDNRRAADTFTAVHRAVADAHPHRAVAAINHALDSSWSGPYLVALRLLRGRIRSKALTPRMYDSHSSTSNSSSTHHSHSHHHHHNHLHPEQTTTTTTAP